ncbi:MAG: transcription termination/antitermination NusG family protein [Planctomycetota bacterium]|nr:transcription termination/antitermination NusG family protein [Planctomycetota bacterium]
MSDPSPTLASLTAPVQRHWMVLHTKARQEKAVARHLAAAGVEHDLPLVERVTVTRGRKHRSEVPLFTGYVFIKGEKQDAYDAISTRRVANFLHVADPERLEYELARVHAAIRSGLPVEEFPRLAIGQRARVTKGPLAGAEGVVIEEARRTCLILHVEILGRGASVEIEADLLEPLDH